MFWLDFKTLFMKKATILLLALFNSLAFAQVESDQVELTKKVNSLVMSSSLGLHFNEIYFNNNPASLNMQHTIGWQFNERLIAGLGFGIEHYEFIMVPTFLDLRFNMDKSKNPLFIINKTGYSHPWPNNMESSKNIGGYYSFTGFGYRSKFTDALSIEFCAGYKHQQAQRKDNYEDWWTGQKGSNLYKYYYHRIEMRIGLFFQ